MPGDKVSVDFATGEICNETTGKVFHAAAFPPFINEIIEAGGPAQLSEEKNVIPIWCPVPTWTGHFLAAFCMRIFNNLHKTPENAKNIPDFP